jgi:hypothetical protein
VASRSPDISERTIIDLSGRLSTYYDLNGNAFDMAVGGLPFIMAVTDSTPYRRQTAEFRVQRVDQMRDPGEHTLGGSGYWTRSQSSWHYGEGVLFAEPMEGNDAEVRFRYRDSYGIDVWTPGEISLLNKTTLVQAFTGKSKVDTGATTAGVPFLVATDMAPVITTTAAATAATSATTITVASTTSIVVGYVASATGITSGTTVSAIGTGSVTLSAATTGSVTSGASITFNPVTAMYKITTAGTSTAFVNYSAFDNKTILATTSDGTYLYVATTDGIYDVKLSDGTAHKAYDYGALIAQHATLKYVKQRIIGAGQFTNGAYAAYELLFPSKGSGASVEIKPTMIASEGTLIDGSTLMPVDWEWTAVTEGSNAIYLGGYAGDHSKIFKLAVDNNGALGTIVTAAVMPRGEIILSLYTYLGTYLMVGTNKGARVATLDQNGDMQYGPLVFQNSNGVYDFEGRDSYIWAGNTNQINTNSGTTRINLAQPITLSGNPNQASFSGVYARATDVFANGISGTVNAVRIFGADNQVAFTVSGSGVWLQHPTDLVESGQIRLGRVRYDTMENKAWKRIRIRTTDDLADGDIEVFKIGPTSDTVITTLYEGNPTTADIDLGDAYTEAGPDASFKLILTRNSTDATTGPVVVGVAVKALPTPTRARIMQIPLFCFDKETDKTGNMIGYEGYSRERLNALETIEANGQTVVLQDFNQGGEPTEVIIDQVTFTRSTPSNRNYTGFGGIIQLIVRTVV